MLGASASHLLGVLAIIIFIREASPCGLPLGSCGPPLGPCGRPLGPCGFPLGHCGPPLGRCGLPLGPCGLPLGPCGPPGPFYVLKSCQNQNWRGGDAPGRKEFPDKAPGPGSPLFIIYIHNTYIYIYIYGSFSFLNNKSPPPNSYRANFENRCPGPYSRHVCCFT